MSLATCAYQECYPAQNRGPRLLNARRRTNLMMANYPKERAELAMIFANLGDRAHLVRFRAAYALRDSDLTRLGNGNDARPPAR